MQPASRLEGNKLKGMQGGVMYEGLELLDPANRGQRVHPLTTYTHLAKQLVVPILHMEFATLSRFWPIAWTKSGDVYTPVAILGFSLKQTLHQRLERAPPDAVPVAIKAFPFVLSSADSNGGAKILFNPPPTSANASSGEAAFLPTGALSPAATLRTDFLWLHAAEQDRTREFSGRIAQADGFELWKLQLVFSDSAVENTQFHVVRSEFLTSPHYPRIAAEFGTTFVSAVEHHVLSRLRIQALADDMGRSPKS